MEDQGAEKNVLVGVTGSVAAIKVPEIVKKLTEYKGQRVKEWLLDVLASIIGRIAAVIINFDCIPYSY